MSRVYRISISESVKKHVKVSDGVRMQLELLPVLNTEQMLELLVNELIDNGFQRDEQTLSRIDEEGIRLTINLEDLSLTVQIDEEQTIEHEAQRTARVEEEVMNQREKALRQQAKQEAQKQVENTEQQLQQAVTTRLHQKLNDLQAEIDQLTNKATANALKIKAAQIGEIEQVEQHEDGSITIQVNV